MYVGDYPLGTMAHCCACTGVCYHIGGPYLCDFHKTPSYPVTPNIWNDPALLPWNKPCEHCYCVELKEKVPHMKCCNCGNRRKK